MLVLIIPLLVIILYLSGNINFQTRISHFSFTGQNLWSWSLDTGLNFIHEQPTESITVLPDSCIIHVFGSGVFADYGLTVVKLNSDGTANNDEYNQKHELEMTIHPNPMCSLLNIEFKSSKNLSQHTIYASIYNIKGQFVKRIFLDKKSPHHFSSAWDGYDSRGKSCPTGTYMIRVNSGANQISKKIVLIK